MAAFGFFRKNRKFVFWVMVILMLVFLLGVGGADPIINMFRPSEGSQSVGFVRDGQAVTLDQIRRADVELQVLRQMGVGDPTRVLTLAGRHEPVPGEMGFYLLSVQQNPELTWALLIQEAHAMGVRISDASVDGLLRTLGITDRRLAQMAGQFRQGIRVDDLRQAAANYLAVAQAFDLANGRISQSEPQLRSTYRDLAEEMELAVVEFHAADLLNEAPEPSEAQIRELFGQARAQMRGHPQNPHPFRVGYYQAPRVQVEYIYIDFQDVAEEIEVDEQSMLRYWRENRGQLTQSVEVPVEAPEGDDQAQPATQTVEMPIQEYYEAKPIIAERLRRLAAQRRIDEIAGRLMEQARAQLAQDEDAPLEALARQARVPGVDLQYRRTQMLNQQRLMADEILGVARAGQQGQSLVEVAFSVPALIEGQPQRTSVIDVGQLYAQPMDVRGPEGLRGKLLWRVADVHQGGVPEALSDEIRVQVASDARMIAAYELAMRQAQELLNQASQQGLESAARGAGHQVLRVGPVARQFIAPGDMLDQQTAMTRMIVGMIAEGQADGLPPEMMPTAMDVYRAVLTPPLFIATPPVTVEDTQRLLVPQEASEVFLSSAFALAPATNGQVAQEQPMKVVAVPQARAAFVVQRVEHQPVNEDGYQEIRPALVDALQRMRRHHGLAEWYMPQAVLERVGFSRPNDMP